MARRDGSGLQGRLNSASFNPKPVAIERMSAGTNRKTQCQREEIMRLTRRSMNLGLAASLTAPALARAAIAADETIKIGMVLPVTGPAADSGKYALTGAKIALDRVNKL